MCYRDNEKRFYMVLNNIEALIDKGAIDGRLPMLYAVSLICAEEVC